MAERFERQIYLLNPRDLSPEAIAVTFAKTSRSPLSFRKIAAELTSEESAQFHEKWVVGYGHASVAEHAVLHLAFENVSRLAIECIESNRLASYTEKSTRYQKWEPDRYYVPQEILGTPDEVRYRSTCDRLFRAYQSSLGAVRAVVVSRFPPEQGEGDERLDRRLRSRYVDACRFLLPAASLANVGMTANARTLEHAISKMLSHPLHEVRQIGREVREVSKAEVPTLVKYAEAKPYLEQTEKDLWARSKAVASESSHDMLKLLHHDPEAEDWVLASALYQQGSMPFESALSHVKRLGAKGRQDLAKAMLGSLDRFGAPLRVLEHAGYTIEGLMDQGAYFEVKRHRMMTQSAQPLTANLGYAIPRLISDAGQENVYREAMDEAAETFRELAKRNPHVASYVVPNGFRRRVLMTLNLREAYHFCELRSAANAHFSVRRIALRMAEILRQVHPILASFMRLPEDADWRQIESEHFSQV
ncbi:MAG: FAD-dependent thymidylate synthase [Anaerolineales bacterium]|jgi:thymidylate synthase ThyX